MKVYLIRHGESVLNGKNIHQYPDTPLSEKGREQSERLAKRFADIEFDLLVTGSAPRARETTEIVNKKHNRKILESSLFNETKRPSDILGRDYKDSRVLAIHEEMVAYRDDPNWRHLDEETFTELRARGIKALQFLIDHEADRIVVISHGDILRLLLSIMHHGKDVTPLLFHRFRYFAPTDNTGVTVCHHGDLERDGFHEKRWYLISWNDLMHLE